jgi:hypothetical protein
MRQRVAYLRLLLNNGWITRKDIVDRSVWDEMHRRHLRVATLDEALNTACGTGDTRIIDLLLEAGAQPKNSWCMTSAARRGFTDIAVRMFSLGAGGIIDAINAARLNGFEETATELERLRSLKYPDWVEPKEYDSE